MKRNQQRSPFTRTLFVLFISLVVCFSTTKAQESTTLVVTVRDGSGAAVPGASIVVDQPDCECAPCPADIKDCKTRCCETRNGPAYCCIAASKHSNDSGTVSFEVNPGRYRLRVEVKNFKTQVIEGVQVSGGQTNVVDVKLDVGAVASGAFSFPATRKIFPRPDPENLILTLGKQGARAVVTVKKAGCNCGECPEAKSCPSKCCECKDGDCVCCVVAEGVADDKGIESFLLAPGQYDISFKVADALQGGFSSVVIAPTDEKVTLSFGLNAQPKKRVRKNK